MPQFKDILKGVIVSDTIPVLWRSGTTNNTSSSFSTVTVTIADEETEATEEPVALASWEGVLGIEGHVTGDGRYFMPGEIEEREFPLTLMVQTINEEGHKGAEVGGRIDAVERVTPEEARARDYKLDDVPDDAVVILANGVFDSSDFGTESSRLVDEEMLRGISVDLAVTEVLLLDPETLKPINAEELDLFELLMGDFVQGYKGHIMGATVVPFPAFEEAVIRTLTASGSEVKVLTFASPYELKITIPKSLVAAAAPLKPPTEWFVDPQFNDLTPLTITKEGHVYGHLADWSGCHTGSSGFCVPPPRSASDYAYFNVGEIETKEGDLVPVGKIMFSMDGGRHAPTDRLMTAEKVMEHYDDTTCVGGYVKAGSDRFGTWISGSLRPNLRESEIQHLRTHPPSGDWRPVQGNTELVAALSVPIPGFPIPRAEAHLVASAGTVEVTALITPPLTAETLELSGFRKRKRKKYMLQERVTKVFGERLSPREKMRQEAMAEK